jgi:hypothetical protein
MSEIICRLNPMTNKPVVFIADHIDYDKGEITVLDGDKLTNKLVVKLNFYQATSPVGADDEKAIIEQYKIASKDQNVILRHKLPRKESRKQVEKAQAKIAPAPAALTVGKTFVDEIEILQKEFNDRINSILARAATKH